MAECLTTQQKQAVTHRGGRLLVSAAAGSGKTKVLVDRLLSFLTDPDHPANIDDFLIITYTKAAAAELRGKISAKLSAEIAIHPENRHLQRQMQRIYLAKISTVHSFCSELLREFAYLLNIPLDFRVGDETECAALRERVMEQTLEDTYGNTSHQDPKWTFLDTQGLGRTDRLVPEILLRVYAASRCHLSPDIWLSKCLADAQFTEITDLSQTTWGRYLMEDLFSYLDLQMDAIQRCISHLSGDSTVSKQYDLFLDTYQQLKHLRESATWDEIVLRRNISYGTLVFSKKTPQNIPVETIKAIRLACKTGLQKKLAVFCDPSEQVICDAIQVATATEGMLSLVKEFSNRYQKRKQSRRILDFSDLEQFTLDILLGKNRQGITSIAREIGNRFQEVMVDEYQDSNVVQDAIFSALTQQRRNLFLVGDVKQSIYQFRLADPEIFIEKYQCFSEKESAKPGEDSKILLSKNFRSGPGVLEAVNAVFRECMSPAVGGLSYGDEEALQEGLTHTDILEPEVELHTIQVDSDTYSEEAEYVASRIQQLLDGSHMVRQEDTLRPISESDIVILLRSPGSVGKYFSNALERRGIAVSMDSGADLLKTPEVESLYNLLQTVSNPRQDIPLIAVLASPIFGYTAEELSAVRVRKRAGCFYEALQQAPTEKDDNTLGVLTDLRESARMNTLSGLLEKILLLTRLDCVYSAISKDHSVKKNIQSFFQLALDYESRSGLGLDGFLQYLCIVREGGKVPVQDETQSGAVRIVSIHKSKGLEYPVVILAGLARRFNREDLRQQVLCHKNMGIGLSYVDTENRVRYPAVSKRAIAAKTISESLSEEMRVLYVAMTRARDRLIMTYASATLEKDIRELSARMDHCDSLLLTSEVSCPGEWVLLTALRRVEAGALFALGGRPENVLLYPYPWKITSSVGKQEVVSAVSKETGQEKQAALDLDTLNQTVHFQYPFASFTKIPSKQTATQKKGREKDQEVLRETLLPSQTGGNWRNASFVEAQTSALTYGNAMHIAMQHIRFSVCDHIKGVSDELDRLEQDLLISAEHRRMLSDHAIAAFFSTSVGKKLQSGIPCVREFKFSILEPCEDSPEDQVLLQGVVDCAVIEPDGISIIDFKTDAVKEEELSQRVQAYTPQLQAYAAAMNRIYKMPVKQMYLYFFSPQKLVSLLE